MDNSPFEVRQSKICILLTATIDPMGVPFMQRNDPLVREKDYITALTNWLDKTGYLILFCENSGYDISRIKKIAEKYKNKEIEFIQFDGQGFPREFGKGYGELLTIKYSIQHSSLVKHSDYIIKVNGRYFIKNIVKIADGLTRDNDVYVVADLKKNLTWADSRVFAFRPSFALDYLTKLQNLINDSKGCYLEHILSRATLKAISDGYKWIPVPSKPVIIGYSGTSDIPSRTSKIRWFIGDIIHRTKNYLIKRY